MAQIDPSYMVNFDFTAIINFQAPLKKFKIQVSLRPILLTIFSNIFAHNDCISCLRLTTFFDKKFHTTQYS